MIRVFNIDAREYIRTSITSGRPYATCFMDPPDNIGLGYSTYDDSMPDDEYLKFLRHILWASLFVADTVWCSFNAKWLLYLGTEDWLWRNCEIKLCMQTFTFYQHNQHDLGNGFRPLLRIQHPWAHLDPDAIRVESERQKAGDKRADPRGKVPSDVFDFPRVTGNSKQRRRWHPTQLHEGLVERCLKLTTPPSGKVLDLFGGTGTTSRVADRLGLDCDYVDLDPEYCNKVAEEFNVQVIRNGK